MNTITATISEVIQKRKDDKLLKNINNLLYQVHKRDIKESALMCREYLINILDTTRSTAAGYSLRCNIDYYTKMYIKTLENMAGIDRYSVTPEYLEVCEKVKNVMLVLEDVFMKAQHKLGTPYNIESIDIDGVVLNEIMCLDGYVIK